MLKSGNASKRNVYNPLNKVCDCLGHFQAGHRGKVPQQQQNCSLREQRFAGVPPQADRQRHVGPVSDPW